MGNVYLDNLRTKYDGIRDSIKGLQEKAAEEKRDLTPEELRSIQEQTDTAKGYFSQIESLTEIETRNRKVAELRDSVTDDEDGEKDQHSRSTSRTTTKDRDPGHYRSVKEGGKNSFFGDLYRAKEQDDEDAALRLREHNRALTSAGEGVGIIPPKWLVSEYAALARQGRSLANAVRHIDLDSPAPLTLPKQTAGASVAEQANENDATSWTNGFDTDVDTVNPKATVGGQEVPRQLIDSSNPAVDALIFGDLLGDYNQKVESKVGLAMVTAAGTAVTTFATNAAFTATAGPDGIIDAAIAVRSARKLPADILVSNVARYGAMLKWKDSTNRPLIVGGDGGPMNVVGVGEVAVDGRIEGLGVIATEAIASTYPESILVARAADTILFESPMLRFKYEEPKGPETVRVGVWAYTAVLVRYAGASVKRLVVTAAS